MYTGCAAAKIKTDPIIELSFSKLVKEKLRRPTNYSQNTDKTRFKFTF